MDSQLEQKFVKQLANDKKLQDDLSKCKSSDDALNVVKKFGFNVTLAEFKTSMAKLDALVTPKKGRLTENDLEMVAGGRQSGTEISGEVIGGVGAAAGCVSAAATAAA
jgi:predicted ribosomally synthesized peptide with nif11-like leader